MQNSWSPASIAPLSMSANWFLQLLFLRFSGKGYGRNLLPYSLVEGVFIVLEKVSGVTILFIFLTGSDGDTKLSTDVLSVGVKLSFLVGSIPRESAGNRL